MSKSWLRTPQPVQQGIGPLFDSVKSKQIIENQFNIQLEKKTGLKGKLATIEDVCANKHGGNPESTAAFENIKEHLTESQYAVLTSVKAYGDYGVTVDGLAIALQKTPNAISGRVSELKRMGKIYKDGTRPTRSGCQAAILKAT